MILTLGPLLVGTSMAISSYLLSLRWASELNSLMDDVLRIFPPLLSWLIYSLVPTVRVPPKDAITGAIIAAVLFELGKKLFTLYITLFPAYQLVYGFLAVIPLLFIWIYWTWCIVLLGAEITVTFDDYRRLNQPAKQEEPEEP